MMKTVTTFAVALACLAAPLAARGEGGVDLAEGRRLYLRLCASCHGTSGRGDGPVAPALGERPTDLTVIARDNEGIFPGVWVFAAIEGTTMPRAHGVSEMPVWGEVLEPLPADPLEESETGDVLTLLTEYLRSIQRR